MHVIAQDVDDILSTLRPLTVDWQDDTAKRVIDRIGQFKVKPEYTSADLQALFDENFDDACLILRLFLGVSKDTFTALVREARGSAGTGVKAYSADKATFIADIEKTGVLDAMATESNRVAVWSDVLVERLRSGRGSAISGQRRGRDVEDFVEAIVERVFGAGNFQMRCTFTGVRGRTAKCDFAIPGKASPRILIESKGYNATGSKMTDILGDVGKIVEAKRADTAFLFFTDGLTWKQRRSDMKKLVEYQNNGDVTRIYTFAMADQFEADLMTLKAEFGI